jgi:hypothetical protein
MNTLLLKLNRVDAFEQNMMIPIAPEILSPVLNQ